LVLRKDKRSLRSASLREAPVEMTGVS
jgi:hypothetical protein